MPISIKYHFTQVFNAPVKKAFSWCTNFDPIDHQLMNEENAEREIARIADGALILKDTFHLPTGTVEKQKLVQLYPEQYTWTSTHLTGPNKYSQFLYVIAPKGKDRSELTFSAQHLEYNEKVGTKQLSRQLCKEDAAAWKLLARELAQEYMSI